MTQGQPSSVETASRGGDGVPASRLLAALVLVPSVPLLILSVGALALFYMAPTRMSRLLEVLPGDQFIRLALFFAPATLFAIVVMAFLYALEPKRSVAVEATRPHKPRTEARRVRLGLVVAFTMAALLSSVALLLLSFVAPGRFGLLLEPLPGDRFLRPLIRLAPFVFSAALVLLVPLAARRRDFRQEATDGGRSPAWSAAEWSVRLLLIPTIPLLLSSLGALILYYGAPERFETLMATLGSTAFLRLVLFFAPFLLFAIIALAVLYLGRPARPVAGAEAIYASATPPAGVATGVARSAWAIAILSAGLTATAMLGLAGMGVVAYLLLR
jgi:hypothetical protein